MPTMPASVEELRNLARTRFTALVREHAAELRSARAGGEGEYPKRLWDALCQDRLVGAPIDPEYGGLGLGLGGMAAVLEELAAADEGDMIPILNAMVAVPLSRYGSDGLKGEILPAVATGERRLAFAVTEREAGSNVFAAETSAVADGDAYVLDGCKHYISGVDLADAILILARTTSLDDCQKKGLDASAGLSLFLVDRDSQGLGWQRMTLPRLRNVTQYAVRLDGVRVPARRLLGTRGFGALPVLDALNVERILIPALVLGAVRWLLETSVAHVKARRVFGDSPIGRYQAVQHPLADVFLRAQALRLLLDEATTTYDSGANPFEVSLPTAAARYLAVEVAEKAMNAAGDALGSRAFEADVNLLEFTQMVRLFKSAPVSNAVLLNFTAEHHLGLPRSS